MNCVETWNIWMRWCNDWNFVWVMPNDLVTLFKSWTGVMMKGGQIRLWKMAFYALVWSLWLFRNDIVFCGKVWDPNQLYKLTELRVATWANAKWPQEYGSKLDTFRAPQLGAILEKQRKNRPIVQWERPAEGTMQRGAVKVKQGLGGY